MSVLEIKAAVSKLSREDLRAFSEWFEEFRCDAWDEAFKGDVRSGKLDIIGKEVDKRFKAGLAKPL